MVEELKEKVFKANLDLVKHGLVLFTWGNVSEIDRSNNLIVIKPSGVSYDTMKASDMVVIDLDGKIVDGNLKPSSDAATHIELYKTFPKIGGIAHSHSTYATAWAQAGRNIPIIGTTHADYSSQDIPCSTDLLSEQIEGSYEMETGRTIIETLEDINYEHIPGVLVKNHGPFTWGKDANSAVFHSVVLEEVAKMAYLTFNINPEAIMDKELVKKHFDRKHGNDAYYGQKD